jgi:hypothetical protein
MPHIIRGAHIARAGGKRGHPHFFVRNTMRAHDRQGREVAVQALDISQQPVLEVENHGFRMGSGQVIPQFLAGAGYVHGKMRTESTGQRPGNSRIALEKNYTLSHTSPSSTAVNGRSKRRTSNFEANGGRRQPIRAAGWLGKPRLHRHLQISNRGQKSAHLPSCRQLFRQRFEWFSLKLPVFLQQNFNFSFRLLQFIAAGGRKLHAFFEQCQRRLQRDFSLFQFLNNFLQPLEALFKLRQRGFRSVHYCNATISKKCPVFFMGMIEITDELFPRREAFRESTGRR